MFPAAIRKLSDFIKLPHTVFALPFALASMAVAARDTHGWPGWRTFLLILAAMVFARTCAMSFNRIADRDFDRANPRTAGRHLPTGQISLAAAWALCLFGAAGLVTASWLLNPVCCALSPIALMIVCFYSLTKRFTDFSHVFLGVALALAPIGAWLAVKGSFHFFPDGLSLGAQRHPPLASGRGGGVLACRIRYHLRLAGLRVRPSARPPFAGRAMGCEPRPVRLLPIAHDHVVDSDDFRLLARFRFAYYVGLIFILVCLLLEHWLARRRSLNWINHAFFRLNAVISVVFLVVTLTEIVFPWLRLETVNPSLQHSGLRDLCEKIAAGRRVSEDNALRLFESRDLNALGAIADMVCRRKNSGRASYILNRYINYSNYCVLSCQFCAFARKKRDADGFQHTTEEIVQKARQALDLGVTELHIVGGLHPSLPFSYYTDMLRALRALDPRLQLKCFTAIEILHLAWLAKKSVRQTLLDLKDAGLHSLTGGGAEIFRQEVRSEIARGKESAEEYLDVHRTWHQLGGRSTCTMLFGHVETLADRVDHLRRLRGLQDETHGFTGFVPLPYQPDNNGIPVHTPPTGFDSLRTIAVSRIYLDNFDHITAYWVGMGLKLAQVALSYGADDLHGTILEENIFHMAGAKSPQLQTEADMIHAIRETGRTPVQRDTFYQPIKVWDTPPPGEPSPTSEPSKILRENLASA